MVQVPLRGKKYTLCIVLLVLTISKGYCQVNRLGPHGEEERNRDEDVLVDLIRAPH